MPRRPSYRLPASRRKRRRKFFWLLILLVVGGGVWVWWTTEQKRSPRPQPHRVVALVNQPAPVPPGTNIVSVQSSAQRSPPVSNATLKPSPTTKPEPVSKPPPASAIETVTFPRPPRDTIEAQIALARLAISAGSIDGVMGSQTRAALAAFQRANHLSTSGEFDAPTRAALVLESAPLTPYIVTSNDLARLQPLSKTWLGKSQQTSLDYESILELLAERGHASPTLIRRLNPTVNWTNVATGDEVRIPGVEYPAPRAKAAFIIINLAERQLQAFDANTNLLAHFPCSIAARFEKRPVGELHVSAIAPNPNYTFDPEVFPESEEARQLQRKLVLPPGPNNPVGTAWISLDKPGYGMHGTPSPEQVGRTESHGCFRLANWNADYLIKLVWVGMPVWVEP